VALKILADRMSSDRSPHTARLLPDEQGTWEVSWIPGRHLDRNQATTAMVIADATASGHIHPRHPGWPHVRGWAAELGMTAPDAVNMAAIPPGSKARYPLSRSRPAHVIVLAASPWVKEHYPASGAGLWDALRAGRDPQPGPEPDKLPDWEAGQ
jgi:hypothetical protein